MADSPPASPDPSESADESEAPVREELKRDGSIFGVFGEKDNDDPGTAVGTSEGVNPPLETYGGGTADNVKVKARGMPNRMAAYVNAAYCLAGCVLFLTGGAPVIQPTVDFSNNTFAKAWAGWKFSSCFYMALVNFDVDLRAASAATQLLMVVVDVYAAHFHPEHWTALAWGFVALEATVAAAALRGEIWVGGAVNLLYCLAGVSLFVTGASPVLNPNLDFLTDSFAVAWAGWKFSGCLYFALVNLEIENGLALATAMAPYVAFDVFAFQDNEHWTSLAAAFIVLDGGIAIAGLAQHAYYPSWVLTKIKES